MAPDPALAAAAAASYKARKEAFVSNLSGSSLTEINLVTLVAASAVFLWTALQKRHGVFRPATSPVALATDFLLNVCAILFATTLYSRYPAVLSIFLITPGVLLLFLQTPGPSSSSRDPTTTKSKASAKTTKADSASPGAATGNATVSNARPSMLPVRPFLTHYRGSMLVATCVAILAVDFPIFPRRFAKVETWGTSLMDLGVGSFVFSAGVVSARSLVRTNPAPQGGGPSTNLNRSGFGSRLIKSLRHSLPLFILGLIRLYSVKGLDYAEHVTEYGVHWNFFFTMAFLPPFVEISDSIITGLFFKAYPYETLALLLALVYELLLNHTDLLAYILISPRGPSLLSQNREGVFSFVGYLAIFLAGRGTGTRLVVFNDDSPPDETTSTTKSASKSAKSKAPTSSMASATAVTRRERQRVLRNLALLSAVYTTLYLVSTSIYTFNLTVSRRLANLPYVLWICAFNDVQILLFGVVEACGVPFAHPHPRPETDAHHESNDKRTAVEQAAFVRDVATSRVLRAFNTNGLVIFLVANLGTGLVNLTVNTLDMPPLQAMGVLILYSAAVTAVAVALDWSGIRIRL